MTTPHRRATPLAAAIAAVLASRAAVPATLPVPCSGAACGPTVSSFVASGQATATQTGSKLTVNQTSANTVLNWQSFNISADGTVTFVQPTTSSVAINQIFQADPSRIFGALNANGQVFLINRNGIIFGQNSQVNVGGLVASTLQLAPTAISGGLLAPGSNGQAALALFTDANGNPLPSGIVSINQGATIRTSDGGQVLVFAPTITNLGSIATPGGQTMLAAGNDVYLASSSDPNLRGLLVEVGTGGTVTNGFAANVGVTSPDQLVGQIIAERGNVTLAGLAVNQLGRISATTSINQNGSIRLQARDQGSISASGAVGQSGDLHAGTGGTLVLGPNSDTDVTLAASDSSTTVDSVAQPKSSVSLFGAQVQVLDGSTVRATSGTIDVLAKLNQGTDLLTFQPDGSRFYLAPAATLDVSGASIELPVSSNVIAVQLRGTELADSPLQRNGPLRGQTVYVDIRDYGTLPNGTPWQGTPLANVSGEIAAIPRNVQERNLTGGTVSINAQGDAILAPGSMINVAGGVVTYTPGYVNTSVLLTATGQAVPIGQADPNVAYTGILNSTTTSNPKWGVSTTYAGLGQDPRGAYQQGYIEGKDAGTLAIVAPQFVLDSAVNGSVAVGPNQRLPAQPLPAGALYRSYDQVPVGATLEVGATAGDFVVGNVTIGPGLVLDGLRNADGTAFNPLTDPLPPGYLASVIRPELVGPGGFSDVIISANGAVRQLANGALQLPAGGTFAVVAGSVDLEAPIDAPGGHISAVAELTQNPPPDGIGLEVGPGAALTARGAWVNDSIAVAPGGNAEPLFINGGSVSLSAVDGNLTLASGSLIDVSGGAQLTNGGALVAGAAGAIQLGALTPSGTLGSGAGPTLTLGATLRGYGLLNGGSLSLTSSAVCIAATPCIGAAPSTLMLTPAEFAMGGFSSYNVTADRGALNVAPGTDVVLTQQNLVMPAKYTTLTSAATLVGLTSIATLPDGTRKPVNLSLSQFAAATEVTNATATLTVTAATPSLDIGAGAVISADPGASLSLNSNVRLIEDGTLSAPGGSIALTLSAALPEAAFSPTQAIWVGPTGTLDARGVSQILVGDTGLRIGTVLGGGSVTLNAARGSIELLPGSLIDVAGDTGTIDVAPSAGAPMHSEQVASAGGSIALTAAESIVLDGTLAAQAGVAGPGLPQPAGGRLSITLAPNLRNDFALGFGIPSSFPQGPRQIIVTNATSPVVVGEGLAIPAGLEGEALVSATAVAAAGFDSIGLTAGPLITASGAVPGEIHFNGNVTLTAGQQINLDAASYAVSAGGTAVIFAPYVSLGNSDLQHYPVPTATSGTGTLAVQGGFVELYGATSLQGIGTASITSTGDLRLRGTQNLNFNAPSTAISGSLQAGGEIDLSAQQIYPATLTQFVIATDPTTGTIAVHSMPGTAGTVLSAGGSLTLSAATILQGGVLRAPFGAITLAGQDVELLAGSLTSTSGNGATVPFGTTQGGFDWVYPLQDGLATVYGTDGAPLPSQQVTLQGAKVNVATGAVIDVSGGGNLQAYEWIPGVGGTRDVLSQSVNPNEFAIVPGLATQVAPYDPAASAGWTLPLGASVYLSGVPGLPAGNYVLLPARYALLPGAYLVSAVPGYTDISPGQSYAAPGGGAIVSGYLTVAGTSFGTSRTSGFLVEPASVALQQAQYTTTGANAFFTSQAATAGVPATRLPEDSGVLALLASSALSLDGTLRTQPATGGQGAGVDISSAEILVTANASAAPQPGEIVISATALNALGAQSLLLGGQRANGAITTEAQTVVIASGAMLTGPELMLTATDQVTVDTGATLTAGGVSPSSASYALAGDGAFLRVAAGPQATITRVGGSGASGVLDLATGSTVNSPGGSAFLGGSANVMTLGTLSVAGGDLGIQSTRISVGSGTGTVAGTVLDPASLASLGLHDLLLASSSTIDFYGGVTLNAHQLTLDSAGLSGYGAAGDAASVNVAGLLTLANTQGATTQTVGNGAGTLTLNAADVALGPGTTTVTGFSGLAVTATNAVTGTGNSTLATTGDLALTASRITTTSAATLDLSATGDVVLGAPSKVATLAPVTDLGGTLAVTGRSISVATTLALPSGAVTLMTTGAASDLALAPGALIEVAGRTQTFDGTVLASPGGRVALLASGNVTLAAGSTINVGAATGGTGGALDIRAASGSASLLGRLAGAGVDSNGASFSLDAQSFGDFSALNTALNAGGFSGSRVIRLRGPGDIVVAAGAANAVTAATVGLEADQGRVVIQGLVDASGASGGHVVLAASGDVLVAGTIDAHATAGGATGGAVALETTTGGVQIEAGSLVDVSASTSGSTPGGGGTVLLRVPSDTVAALATGGTGVVLAGTITGASRTTLEGFKVYNSATGVVGAADVAASAGNPLYADAVSFMSNAPAITAALGQGGNAAFAVAPGIEIQSAGTLTLASLWNLYGWRFNGTPGILTLRAGGGVTIAASLSDGFAALSGSTGFSLPAVASDSWSYRIVGGADLGAANPLATSIASSAGVTIAAGSLGGTGRGSTPSAPTMIRTGNGFIDVSAAGDLVFGNQASVLYTAGVAGPGIPLNGRSGSLQGRAYPINGGDITVSVGGNIDGAVSNQFVTAWLWRSGGAGAAASAPATAWTVDYQSFQQGIAALGGGDVQVRAGGDISNLSVSVPSIGRQVGGTTIATSEVQVVGGGNLDVTAGGSILGGGYYVGLGTATLVAGRDVGAIATSAGGTGAAPLIGLGTGSVSVTGRDSVEVSGIVNPTLLPTGATQTVVGTYFSTYAPDASASLVAVGGNVMLPDQSPALATQLTSMNFRAGPLANQSDPAGAPVALDILPPSLSVASLSGDVELGRVLGISPSAQGTVQVFAAHSVVADPTPGGVAALIVSDAGPSSLPSIASPQNGLQIYADVLGALGISLSDQHGATPTYVAASPTAPDPVHIVAATGDVSFPAVSGGSQSGIWSATPVRLVAGQDIINLDLIAQNTSASDVTAVIAGRDIVYPEARTVSGLVEPNLAEITVDGPGELTLVAGRNVNLGTSAGVTTRGNLANNALPAGGASVSIDAGVADTSAQLTKFVATYIDGSTVFDADLISFVEARTGANGLDASAAKTVFASLGTDLQRVFVEQEFFSVLRTSGRAAAKLGNGDFSAAFTAIEALFPGANPNLAAGQTNAYQGNIELYFSRVYTLSGGDISLLAPGGEINVGLAVPPSAFGITKGAAQLGIVAQSVGNVSAFAYNDFQVNQSRVFAADGGNILVWSTDGNIDAGRGAKTAISAPPPTITIDSNGRPTETFPAALTGSGIQTLATSSGVQPGDVDLFAPHGVVNANDAGIVAGNLTIAATAVLGASNITVSGTSVGVPVAVTGLGASAASASASAGGAANAAEAGAGAAREDASKTPVADTALGWLEVFVTGLGEDACRPDDLDCLRRQKKN